MRAILQKKALRYVFGANMISMLGSGMNSAAVAWYNGDLGYLLKILRRLDTFLV